ncbi:hypothetical protein [Ornithinibacillus halophilus]|uniref:Type IV pilus assembly protein PilN n=1 Tax=Ornithinibacillus halophilus TaxID=930117 RepID=A0A1M5EHD8_9BACI|nr:hypothetical protein [Ornithinibacillus halophilus]SHF78678.1 hypothetical protein SAMN05216225_100526 [Ornithinibacillus halophilus]
MNTEINFLERQPKKYVIPLVLGITFLLFLAVAIVTLYYQQLLYDRAIENEERRLGQIEELLVEHSQETATTQQLRDIQKSIISIQEDSIPNVALYRNVLGLLTSSDQLSNFTYSGANQFVLEASFADLESVAQYVGTLLEQAYVTDATLSSVTSATDAYQATLTFNIDVDLLREELGNND